MMKVSRTAATLILSAAIMAVSIGSVSAQSESSGPATVDLSGLVCDGVYELLAVDTVADIDGASIMVEIVTPARPFDPIQAWQVDQQAPVVRYAVARFTCAGSSPWHVAPDIATTP